MSAVILRCNATPGVGLGHLMRCRALARVLETNGHAAHIIGLPDAHRTPKDDGLFASIEPEPTTQGAAPLIAAAKRTGGAHVMFDDYRGTPEVQADLAAAGLVWLQQFDASRPMPFIAPLLANMSLFEAGVDYETELALGPETRTLFGPAYAVLREEFRGLKPIRPREPVDRVLISFGGGDDHGALAKATEAATGLGLTPVPITGTPPEEVPALMASCDLAILAGGTMSYEASYLGLPLILVPVAANQLRACRGWQTRAEAIVLDSPQTLTVAALEAALKTLIDDPSRRSRMGQTGLVDGQGAERLISALFERGGP